MRTFLFASAALLPLSVPAQAAGLNEDQLQLARWIGAAEASAIQCPGLKLSKSIIRQRMEAVGLKPTDYEGRTEFRRVAERQKSSLLGIGQLRLETGTLASDLSTSACDRGLSMYGPSGRFVPGLMVR